MTVLNCDVKNCYFNKSSKCCKDGIQIGGTDATIMDATYCEDFREKTNSMTNTVEHCNCGPETKMDVKCDAVHCTYNDNYSYNCNYIFIFHFFSSSFLFFSMFNY